MRPGGGPSPRTNFAQLCSHLVSTINQHSRRGLMLALGTLERPPQKKTEEHIHSLGDVRRVFIRKQKVHCALHRVHTSLRESHICFARRQIPTRSLPRRGLSNPVRSVDVAFVFPPFPKSLREGIERGCKRNSAHAPLRHMQGSQIVTGHSLIMAK